MIFTKVCDLKLQRESEAYFKKLVTEFILENNIKSICEVGAGPNPILSEDFVQQNGIDYLLVDKDEEELKKRNHPFKKRVSDLCEPEIKLKTEFDLVLSKMVLEHVENPEAFHKNIRQLLKADGTAIHFFATLYSIPAVANLLLPEKISFWLLKKIKQRDFYYDAKFEAYYRKCFGPRKKALHYFQHLDFKVKHYIGFVGHSYFWRYLILKNLERIYSNFLLRSRIPFMSTTAVLVLAKNE